MNEIVRTDLNAGVGTATSRVRQPEKDEIDRVQQAVQYLNGLGPTSSQEGRYPSPTSRLEVGYDDASRRLVIRLVDSTTKAVLFEMPSRDVIRMAADARRATYDHSLSPTSGEGITA